ncbi:hypothetical protein P4O66_015349 [Electrophorus voltai]|uniref:Tc1-like transposase DDE domain-containing protein n=1 Tax=Electrophorus voltai TaxID=2609070 RepID=A0AAD9DNN8_9TELE|nr:hypothetical protein P4O66_015349 [Electrophorus voltai]
MPPVLLPGLFLTRCRSTPQLRLGPAPGPASSCSWSGRSHSTSPRARPVHMPHLPPDSQASCSLTVLPRPVSSSASAPGFWPFPPWPVLVSIPTFAPGSCPVQSPPVAPVSVSAPVSAAVPVPAPRRNILMEVSVIENSNGKEAATRLAIQRKGTMLHVTQPGQSKSIKDHQIKTLSWPAQSPDHNPIENLWNVIKRKMDGHKPSNKAELMEFLCQEWRKVTQQQCERLVESMPRRMKAVIKNQGYSTKY